MIILFLLDYMKFLLFSIIVWLCYSNFKAIYKWNEGRKMINLLPGPQTIPILGNIHLFISRENLFQVCGNIVEKFKDVNMPIRVWIGNRPAIIINRVQDAHALMHSSNSFEKEESYKYMREFLGQGLITGHVGVWTRHRRLMTPMFNQKLLESFVPIFNKHSKELVEIFRKEIGKDMFDVTYYIAACLLDFVCDGIMGTNIDAQGKAQETKQFVDSVMNCMEITQTRLNNPWLRPGLLFKLSGYSQIQLNYYKNVRSWIDNVISRKVEQHFKNRSPDNKVTKTPTCVLGQLLDLTQSNSEDKWTKKEVVEEVDNLFIAAVDTSGTTVALTLMLVGMYPHVQEKLYNEIYGIFGDSDRDIVAEDVRKLVYMERVLKETLRFYPVAPFIGRKTTGTVQLENCKIPEGTDCLLNIRSIHMNPKYWGENSEVYDPDRFSPERLSGIHPKAFLAFSVGPRNCIGQKYSYIAMKILLSTILKNYKIYCDMKMKDINPNINLAIRLKDGYRITIEKRRKITVFPINKDDELRKI